tara:strand:- start:105 stop:365 length:261 start_codon:yes stop_codon:yes gene_type:complete
MASEVVNLRERIEKVRAEMAGDSYALEVKNEITSENESVNYTNASKKNLPDFKLNIQNPVPPKMLLLLILIQLITSISLVLIMFFK